MFERSLTVILYVPALTDFALIEIVKPGPSVAVSWPTLASATLVSGECEGSGESHEGDDAGGCRFPLLADYYGDAAVADSFATSPPIFVRLLPPLGRRRPEAMD